MNATEVKDSVHVPEPAPEQPPKSRGRRRAFLIFFLVLVIAATGGIFYWLHARQFEETDDAYVEMHLNPVSPRIDGVITKVYVEDNQVVHAGDPLVDLDARDYDIALHQAEASLAQARSQVTAQQPNVPITQVENVTNIASAEANVANTRAALAAAEHDRDSAAAKLTEAEANNAKAQADLGRYKILIEHEEVSRQEYDQVAATAAAQAASVNAARAAVASAERIIEQRRAQVQEAETRVSQYQQTATQQLDIRRASVRSQQASSQSAAAQLEQAQLKLSYTKIVAPVSGIVMKRSAEVGAHVSAGQQLLTIAQTGDLWVTANFKETQLINIRPGQSARIHVDALRRDFDGSVENIGGGTGAISSVLPPENATGNYVKIVQRIPVRLRFRPGQDGMDLLRAGMSVEPNIRISK
ncbi:MAG: HlyD family secretion protein [Acidobacteriaceae bacterium]|nr:HlyD family secretion protein [Acidobacteriaceae bacterium]